MYGRQDNFNSYFILTIIVLIGAYSGNTLAYWIIGFFSFILFIHLFVTAYLLQVKLKNDIQDVKYAIKERSINKHCDAEKSRHMYGLQVNSIRDGAALERGMREGDVIFMFSDRKISSNNNLEQAIKELKGQEVKVSVVRNNAVHNLYIKAGSLGINCSEKKICKLNCL